MNDMVIQTDPKSKRKEQVKNKKKTEEQYEEDFV